MWGTWPSSESRDVPHVEPTLLEGGGTEAKGLVACNIFVLFSSCFDHLFCITLERERGEVGKGRLTVGAISILYWRPVPYCVERAGWAGDR